ncbi:hypothetical protein L1887_43536 [Cichorium endivia]|nr:hypothetical protein L1887_43536 [Cichorium endivia]
MTAYALAHVHSGEQLDRILDLHPVRRADYRHFSLANSTGKPLITAPCGGLPASTAIYADPYMQAMGDQCLTELQWAAGASGLFSMVVFIAVTWFIASIGRKESEDEYISGMQLTDKTC